MRKNRDVLKAMLIALIAVFVMLSVAFLLLEKHKSETAREREKQAAMQALESIPKATPTAAVTVTPTPEPTATPTPTPAITRVAAFNPDDYWNLWYSLDGRTSINIYDISASHVAFGFSHIWNNERTEISEADVSTEIAGNATALSFTDSWGNTVSGSMTFDAGKLYVRFSLGDSETVNCVMSRNQPEVVQTAPTQAAETVQEAQPGDYYFADSNSRYLTDEELNAYSSSDLELAKNEIFARHGRKFITERIADYFNGKSWYTGTVEPDVFDAEQNAIFNEYELANIQKIAEIEEQKRNAGN